MSFAEFGAVCAGFEDFHSPPDQAVKTQAPSDDAFWKAVGVTHH